MEFDKVLDAASYDPVAKLYGDHINRLGAPLADRAVTLGHLKRGQNVLDVGTGTGIAARRAAAAVGPTGHVTGIDLSFGMIQVARDSASAEHLDNVSFDVMDAESLQFSDQLFDCVLSLCAVAHFPDLIVSLTEMRRVMKPRSELVLAIGAGRPGFSPAIFPFAATRFIQQLRGLLRPQLWAPHSMEKFVLERVAGVPQPEETTWSGGKPFKALLRHVKEAGFHDVRSTWTGHSIEFETAEGFWDAQSSIITSVRKRLAQLPEERVVDLRSEFIHQAQLTLDAGGALIYPYGAFYVTGTAP